MCYSAWRLVLFVFSNERCCSCIPVCYVFLLLCFVFRFVSCSGCYTCHWMGRFSVHLKPYLTRTWSCAYPELRMLTFSISKISRKFNFNLFIPAEFFFIAWQMVCANKKLVVQESNITYQMVCSHSTSKQYVPRYLWQ